MVIGLFLYFSKMSSAMSSGSSRERWHKKKKHHHWRGGDSSEGVVGELSSAMKDLRQQLSKDFKEIQESPSIGYFYCTTKFAEMWKTRPNTLICLPQIPQNSWRPLCDLVIIQTFQLSKHTQDPMSLDKRESTV